MYNPHIIIERSISSNGGGSYKIRANKDGRIISDKRSELDAICSYFNLTIDSPLTILTQDQARSFLQNADESTLYKVSLGYLVRP